jgi:hypothetical protein
MKTLLRIILVGIALVLFSEMALAATVTGRGAESCGVWVKDREDESRGRSAGSTLNITWLLGYLSGLSAATGKDFWDKPNVNSLDNESVALWMDNYCRANPLKGVAEGANGLFLERTRIK